MARHSSGAVAPNAVTGEAGDQPGAIPVFNGTPSYADLPVDQGTNEPTGLMYLDESDGTVKAVAPDGGGGVATGALVDLSASISLGDGDLTGLL